MSVCPAVLPVCPLCYPPEPEGLDSKTINLTNATRTKEKEKKKWRKNKQQRPLFSLGPANIAEIIKSARGGLAEKYFFGYIKDRYERGAIWPGDDIGLGFTFSFN